MALDFASMLLQPTKTMPWDLGSGDSTAREQLKLARERFEEEKRENDRQREWAKVEENGRNARAAMERQEALRKEEELRKAALLAKQQEALQKAGELGGTGKAQQLQAMAPYLDQLGYDMNTLGSVGGLPVFQLQNRAQEAARAATALPPPGLDETAEQSALRLESGDIGYPTNERGTLDAPPPPRETAERGELGFDPAGELDEATADALTPGDADIATAGEFGDEDATVSVGRGMVPGSLSSGDAYAQALAASQHAREKKAPLRGPDEEDWMGAVPRNVIDMSAMAAETNARMSPMLKSITGSLPSELQPGAKATAEAAAGLGFEASDALAAYDKGITPAIDIYKGKQNIEAQKAKANELGRMDKSQLRARGSEKLEGLYKEREINKSLKSIGKAAEVSRVLRNKNKEDDGMVASAVMDAQNVVGAPSNTDLELAFNIPKGSLITKGIAIIEEAIQGGMSDAQKAAIESYMLAVEETQKRNISDYLDNAFDTIDNDDSLDPEERAGFKSRLERSVPASVYNEYWTEREKREKESGARRGSSGRGASSAPASTGEAGAELQRQAEAAGLNGQVLGRLMGGESGGKTSAANENRTDGAPKSSAKGVFQLIDSTAQLMGYKDAAEYAAQPLDKQIEVGLKLFQNKGITKDSPPEDYALVLAAPSLVGKWKSRDDVVYKKGSTQHEGNAPWWPADGGDITIGSIADYYMGKGGKTAEAAPAKAETTAALPEPKTAAEKRIVELLKKQGG
jgi:hypothetical protein